MNTTTCIGSIAVINCGYNTARQNTLLEWRIIKRSDDGSVISDMTLSVQAINSNTSNRLEYIPDLSSGANTFPNSSLLVGPVDETDNQSSYQCIFTIGNDVIESSIGTLTVNGMYVCSYISVSMHKCRHTYVHVFYCNMWLYSRYNNCYSNVYVLI